jgi:FkbM family methyltransferase
MHPILHPTYRELVRALRARWPDLTFEVLEIGALPLTGQAEPFHRLLDDFPGSRVHAFELDPESCRQLEAEARSGVIIHPAAIGARTEDRTVYLTTHPMCTSLYRPDERLLRQFHNLQVAYLRDTDSVETSSLDALWDRAAFGDVDFVKIDIQGAELDAFVGGKRSLAAAVAIVTEVEFAQIYEGQPLFGDVDRELRSQGFMFHKFLGMSGRALRPIVYENDPNAPAWHLWSDAMFVRHLFQWDTLEPMKLAKLAILAFLYGSPDVTFRCLQLCDQREGTKLTNVLIPDQQSGSHSFE